MKHLTTIPASTKRNAGAHVPMHAVRTELSRPRRFVMERARPLGCFNFHTHMYTPRFRYCSTQLWQHPHLTSAHFASQMEPNLLRTIACNRTGRTVRDGSGGDWSGGGPEAGRGLVRAVGPRELWPWLGVPGWRGGERRILVFGCDLRVLPRLCFS